MVNARRFLGSRVSGPISFDTLAEGARKKVAALRIMLDLAAGERRCVDPAGLTPLAEEAAALISVLEQLGVPVRKKAADGG